MLSLVNYGASDSEDNISDEEEVTVASKAHENGKIAEEKTENLESKINLPQPISQSKHIIDTIEEDDDEFLHKKEVPEVAPPVPKIRQKVKITIPKLSDFKDEDDNADLVPKYPTASNKKTGLLNMLPKPAHSSAPMNKPSISVPQKQPQVESKNNLKEIQPSTSSTPSSSNSQVTKKIGLIPYALMDHSKKPADDNKKSTSKRKPQDSDDSDEEAMGSSFFSFDTKIEDLPKVNDEEIQAMVEKERNRIEERRKKAEQPDERQIEEQDYSQYYQEQNQQQQQQMDQEAMKALIGGTKAKRSKLDDIQIVDISDREVLPDKDEWLRKNLAGETSFIPTGKIDEKGPNQLAKRKHQISYLSMRAEKNVAELEAMWAANRQSNREGRSKYGF